MGPVVQNCVGAVTEELQPVEAHIGSVQEGQHQMGGTLLEAGAESNLEEMAENKSYELITAHTG